MAERRAPLIETIWRDSRFAVRSLTRDRTSTMVAIGTLALAIAAATATVSVVSGVLLRDIPIERPGDVFVLWKMPAATTDHLPITYAQLTAFRAVTRSFSAVAGVAFQGAVDVAMLEGDRALSIAATWVTGDFFTVLGPVPAAGRLLSPADDAPGAEPVMVISHRFWQSHFGASPSVLGRGLLWNGKRYAIVGILPRGFEYPKRVDAWMPVLSAFPATRDASEGRAEIMVFDAVGRLRAHQAAPSARKDFAHFLHADDASGPADERGMRPVVTGLTDLVVGDMSRILRAVAAAVSLLLLVACMNVATLQLVRGEARANELAIRTALGASRARLIQQLLTEAGVVALVGGAAGIAIATGSLHTLIALVPASLPQRDMIVIDGQVLAVSLCTTLVVLLLAGLVPAVLSARGDLSGALRVAPGASSKSPGHQTLRNVMIVAQIALAVVAVLSAALVVRSLRTLQTLDLGFSADRLLIVETNLPASAVAGHDELVLLQESMLARLRAIPGVVSATAMPKPPYAATGGWLASFHGEGQSLEARAANPPIGLEVVGSDYVATLQIPLVRGRAFDAQDAASGARTAVISEQVARRTWPGVDPIGKRITMGTDETNAEWHTVVGVVRDTRYRELTSEQPMLYLPTRQFGGPVPLTLGIRTTVEPTMLLGEIRRSLVAAHPALAVVSTATMLDRLRLPMAGPRFSSAVLGAFATITLLLALVGIYGSLTVSVRQRTREFGIRMALGASSRALRRRVIRHGILLAIVGLATGVAVALFASSLLRPLLFSVRPTDPVTYAMVCALVLVAAALACWFPARRAARIEPAQVLRNE